MRNRVVVECIHATGMLSQYTLLFEYKNSEALIIVPVRR